MGEQEVQVLSVFELPRTARLRGGEGLSSDTPLMTEIRRVCSNRVWVDALDAAQDVTRLTFRIHTTTSSALTFEAFHSWLDRMFTVVSEVSELFSKRGIGYD